MSRIIVDRNRCEGHALCVALVPDIFEIDDEDKATVPGVVSDDQLDNVGLAVDTCPVAALRVEPPLPPAS
ncbi:ferredoxin [Nocardia sp. NPDC005366]|uniref:ferredoxin n=1 Tax=Nocardia sp. NPDC005366 TaxID=3156878 RepID=UPI0033B55530